MAVSLNVIHSVGSQIKYWLVQLERPYFDCKQLHRSALPPIQLIGGAPSGLIQASLDFSKGLRQKLKVGKIKFTLRIPETPTRDIRTRWEIDGIQRPSYTVCIW